MNKTLWIVLAAIVIFVGGYAFIRNSQTATKEEAMFGEEKMVREDDSAQKENTIIQKEDAATEDDKMMDKKEGDKIMAGQTAKGAYIDYSPAALSASTENGKAVLFFWAAWCPFCKSANEAFTSRTSEIPDGVTVLKTNYDTEKELKTKYGVTYQHTFVQVDASGKMLAKWNGGDLDSLKANLK